jgi:pimeloyl-ACP methyl ester carboxylesterase
MSESPILGRSGVVRRVGVDKARVVGHDIGLMVAYAYAAQFPAETEKLC